MHISTTRVLFLSLTHHHSLYLQWAFGKSKYVSAQTDIFTTALQPLLPQEKSVVHSCEELIASHEFKPKDIVWDEVNQICIHDSTHSVESKGCCTDSLSLLRGAFLKVSVYVRRVWQIQLVSQCTSGSTSQECVTSSNTLQIGDELVGGTAVDLSTLAVGMREVSGWYHLIDAKHLESGQIFFTAALPFMESTDVTNLSIVEGDPLSVLRLLSLPTQEEPEEEEKQEEEQEEDYDDNSVGENDKKQGETTDDTEMHDSPQLKQEYHEYRGQRGVTEWSSARMVVNISVDEEECGARNSQPWKVEEVRTNLVMQRCHISDQYSQQSSAADKELGEIFDKCKGQTEEEPSVDCRSLDEMNSLALHSSGHQNAATDNIKSKYLSAGIDESAEYSSSNVVDSAEYSLNGIDESAEYSLASAVESTEHSSASAVELTEYSLAGIDESTEYSLASVVESTDHSSASALESAECSSANDVDSAEHSLSGIVELAEYSSAGIDESAEHSSASAVESAEYSSAGIDESTEYSLARDRKSVV